MVRETIRRAFNSDKGPEKHPVLRRRLGVLYLKDEVLVMYTNRVTHSYHISYAKEMKNLLCDIYGYGYIPSDLPVLKYFQRENVEWHPVFVDWNSIHMSNKFLEQLEGHDCTVRPLIGHVFEEQLLERLDEGVLDFVENLRKKKAA